jgi:hypothetical protein
MEKKQKPEPTPQQKKVGCIILSFFGLLFLVIIIAKIFSDSPKKSSPEPQKFTKFGAFYDSKQFVEQRLKSPGSAQWSDFSEELVEQVNDTTFKVVSYVDSQNGFGALLRSYYKCTIIYRPTINKVMCEDLKMEAR